MVIFTSIRDCLTGLKIHRIRKRKRRVGRLKSLFVVTDEEGKAWQGSDPPFEGLYDRNTILAEMKQIERTKQPVLKIITGNNVRYQVISSVMTDADHGRHWYVALGRSLAEDEIVVRRFRRNFMIFLTVAVLACALVSWYSAGKALRALKSVERAAQGITGSNLGVQIAKRGADDELDRLIDSFNEMSRRLKASFDQIRQFSTDVSHELRTPLTAIQGQLEVALFTATQKEQLRESIENALQDVERLSNLVRALLLLSQSETGQLPMNKSALDLSLLVEDLVDQFQIPAEGMRSTVDPDAERTCVVRSGSHADGTSSDESAFECAEVHAQGRLGAGRGGADRKRGAVGGRGLWSGNSAQPSAAYL